MKKIAISVLILALIASTLSVALGAGTLCLNVHDGGDEVISSKRTNTVLQLDGYGGVNSHTRAYYTKFKCPECKNYYFMNIYHPEPHTFKQISYTYVTPHLIVYTDKCGPCGRTRTRTEYK